jgi:hypothetical protein
MSIMNWTLFKKCALEVLSIDQNLLVDVNDVVIDVLREQLKVHKTYEIFVPETKPKPSNLLSEWPPSGKMYFCHNYFSTDIAFVSLGDHIATFEPKYKNIVVMLSRPHDNVVVRIIRFQKGGKYLRNRSVFRRD